MNILDLGGQATELTDAYFKDDDPGQRRYRNVRDGFLYDLMRKQCRAEHRAELLAGSGEPVAWLHRDGYIQRKNEYISQRHVDEFNSSLNWMRLHTPDQLAAERLRERERCTEVTSDLLEALQLMLVQFTKTPSSLKDTEARGKAHAAIAKATGGTA